jgi:hypothetical protein
MFRPSGLRFLSYCVALFRRHGFQPMLAAYSSAITRETSEDDILGSPKGTIRPVTPTRLGSRRVVAIRNIHLMAASKQERIREVGQGRAFCARRASLSLRHIRAEPDGDLAAVMKAMGHRGVKTAMQYQHPELEIVRVIINDRNARHNLRHKTEFLQ